MQTNGTGDRSSLRPAIARLLAAMMVADRRVSTEEIDEANRLDHVGLGPLSPLVREELQRATRMPIDVDGACAALSGAGPALVGLVLSALAGVALSDGAVDDDERRLFGGIASRLGALATEIQDYLEPDEPREAPVPGAVVARRAVLADDGAKVLREFGLEPVASSADIEAAYLRLVDRYDPAKMAPLGAEFVALAARKLAAITELYELARNAARG